MVKVGETFVNEVTMMTTMEYMDGMDRVIEDGFKLIFHFS